MHGQGDNVMYYNVLDITFSGNYDAYCWKHRVAQGAAIISGDMYYV